MPELTYDFIAAALAFSTLIACFFQSFRCIGVLIFSFTWMCFTPIRPWYIDIPLMFGCIGIVEVVFRIISNKVK